MVWSGNWIKVPAACPVRCRADACAGQLKNSGAAYFSYLLVMQMML